MRARKRRRIRWGRMIAAAAVLLLIVAAGVFFLSPLLAGEGGGGNGGGAGTVGGQGPDEPDVQAEPESPVALRIICAGDVMVHETQLKAQYNSGTGAYDFSDNFQYVAKYIQEADLALCNVETTFSGGTPTGYPSFNAPDILAQNLAEVGFDVALTANNHYLDKGIAGMNRTLDILRAQGFVTAGTKKEGEKGYSMVEVQGVKIAVIAYTYETQPINGRRTVNGIYIPESVLPLLNSYSYEYLDQDLVEVKTNVDAARADGADLVILYFHWGEEYQNSANTWQRSIAKQLGEMGPDIIFGSHPHVIQEAETITNSAGKQIPVFYSMGNFISNQRAETLSNRYTENAILAGVELEYMVSTGELVSIDWDVQPMWLDRYSSGGKNVYALIPLNADLDSNPALQASGHLSRAKQSLEDAKKMYGEDRINY